MVETIKIKSIDLKSDSISWSTNMSNCSGIEHVRQYSAFIHKNIQVRIHYRTFDHIMNQVQTYLA